MSKNKKFTLVVCLMFATIAFISCNSTESSSSATDSSAVSDSSSMQMQMAPETSSDMSDTAITDSATRRPVKNPPKP